MQQNWIETNISDNCNGRTFKTGESFPMAVVYFNYESQKGDLISIFSYDGHDQVFHTIVTTGQSLAELMKIAEFVYDLKGLE